jgi:hypothetical protein
LRRYPNSCKRLHFFSLDEEKLKLEIKRLQLLASQPLQNNSFISACASFSREHYIGFAVIKPLPGCPVGRTVLRCLPGDSGKGHHRLFGCAFDYSAHLFGLPLTVYGLAFQQQDLGVSACATTALWTSLQNARQLEQSGAATPAQITMRASQFTLPFGRPMPSPGLSIDQMCQAIQSLGYSPNLYRAESGHNAFVFLCAILHSAISSGISPVLIMDLQSQDVSHAVAVAGMGVGGPTDGLAVTEMGHSSSGLVALYIHDDRNGPYVKATIGKRAEELQLRLGFQRQKETWILTHILIPMHAKIRLSFRGLYEAGLEILLQVQAFLESQLRIKKPGTSWTSQIVRSHSYIESLLRAGQSALADRLCESIPLPRYMGIIHIEAPSLDPFDVILDTTSTERNLNCLGVVQLGAGKTSAETTLLCKRIARKFVCRAFI